MYNEAEKIKYVEQFSSKDSKNEFVRVFKAAEPFEQIFQKDLAGFNRDELLNFLNSLEMANPLTIKKYLSRIHQYQKDVNPYNQYLEHPLSKDDIDLVPAMRKNFFKSFSDVMIEVQKARPLNAGYPEPAILAFAWMGFESDEIGPIEKKDVNLVQGYVLDQWHGQKIKMENSVLEVLRAFDGVTTSYRDTRGTFVVYAEKTPYFLKRMFREDSKKKPLEPKPFTAREITTVISGLKQAAAVNGNTVHINYADVQRSGQFYRLYQAEQNGIDICSVENAGILCRETRIVFKRYYDILAQYKAYKKAFDLT